MALAAAKIPQGIGVDTDAKLSPYLCRVLKAAGKVWVARYVPLPNNRATFDIDANELLAITEADLACSLIQHVRSGHWSPGAWSGTVDGATAANHAKSVGYPLGCHLYLDLEAMTGNSAEAIEFANDWAEAVENVGYRAGLYHGYDVTLTPDQLYHDLIFDSYWKAPGPWHVSVRGDAIVQGLTLTIAGAEFDIDEIKPDLLNELPYACVSAPADVA